MGIVLKIVLLVLSMFEVYMCYQFLFLCWADKKELNHVRKAVLVVFIIVTGIGMGANRVLFLFSQWMFVLQVGLVCISLVAIPAKRKYIGIELVSTYFALVAMGDFVFAFIEAAVFGGRFPEMIFWGMSFYKVVIFAVVRSIIYLVYTKVRDKERLLKETVLEYHKGFLIFAISALIILRVYQLIFVEQMFKGALQEMVGLIVSLMTLIFVLCFVMHMMLKNLEMRKKIDFISLKENMLNEHYQKIATVMEESREHVHDMKHHLQILGEYAKEEEIDKIKAYLKEIGVPIRAMEKIVWTESEILNLILNQKKAEAKNKNIDMNIMIAKGYNLPLTDSETCSLFSNLLDNSLEACERITHGERWIELYLGTRGEMRFINVKNSIDRQPVVVNGEFQSSKQDKELHGLGIDSVRRIVEKYDGVLALKAETFEFHVYITFFRQ